jgi:hypothetical protein
VASNRRCANHAPAAATIATNKKTSAKVDVSDKPEGLRRTRVLDAAGSIGTIAGLDGEAEGEVSVISLL